MAKKEGQQEQVKKTCRKCGHGPYTPSFAFDFYEDGKAGPGTGLCERCMMSEATESSEPAQISEKHCATVCEGKGGSAVCRFLVFNTGFRCAKGSNMHTFIQSRAETMVAKGDNCSGSPDFKAQ